MGAGRYNLHIDQGETFRRVLTWTSGGVTVDMTGYTAAMQIRRKQQGQALALDVAAIPSAVTLGTDGTITVTIPDESTDTLPVGIGLSYDLYVTSPGGQGTALLYGDVTVRQKVSQ